MIDIRVHELFYQLLHRCVHEVPLNELNIIIDYSRQKRGIVRADKCSLRINLLSMMSGNSESLDTLTRAIAWELLVDPSTTVLNVFRGIIREKRFGSAKRIAAVCYYN